MPTSYVFLASTLIDAGFECVLIDDRFDRAETLRLIDENLDDALVVLVATATGRMLYNARRLASYVKNNRRDVPICVGGPHASALPELTIQEPNFDYLLTGQAQFTIVDLCRYIKDGSGCLEEIPNLYYKKDNTIARIHTMTQRVRIDQMPELPYFDQSFIDVRRYLNPETRAINYMTSQGCVGSCSFCYYPDDYKFGSFDLGRVMSDLRRFKSKYNMRNISFEDPTLFFSRSRIMNLCDHLINENIDCVWRGNARVNTLKKFSVADLQKVREAGCDVIHIGMESGSERILRLMNKNIDISDMRYLLMLSSESGITFRFHLIIGIPTETIDDLKQTAEVLGELRSDYPNFDYTVNVFTPFPGNRLTQLAQQYGYEPPVDLDGYEKLELLNNDLSNANDRTIVKEINVWEHDVAIPWFDASYTKMYFETFRALIPEKKYFKTTGGKLISAYAEQLWLSTNCW